MATILIVDDNPNITNYLDALLLNRGHRVLPARNVSEAMELCRIWKPDLIITDVLMPGVDGFEFVRLIRSEKEVANSPVIFFTGSYSDQREALALAEACGVARVLSKTSPPEKILEAVDSVLGSSRSETAAAFHPEFEREHAELLADKLFANLMELEASNKLLGASEQQLHRLAGRLRSAQEDERKRIARQLHDELGQALTMLKMNCTWISARLVSPPEGVMERLQTSIQLADETIGNVRRLATELRPGILDLGIAAAIEWQAEEFQDRSEIKCVVDLCERDDLIDAGAATELFRIFQEALTNIVRHAHATEVHITLAHSANSDLVLEVCDNGRGITDDQIANRQALGLLGMRERASLIGAEFSINGNPGNGTRLRVAVPVRLPSEIS
jgi:signal transduction histidine kinase